MNEELRLSSRTRQLLTEEIWEIVDSNWDFTNEIGEYDEVEAEIKFEEVWDKLMCNAKYSKLSETIDDLLKLVDDLWWEDGRMSQSGKETLEKIEALLKNAKEV